jgi:hypothetical protein
VPQIGSGLLTSDLTITGGSDLVPEVVLAPLVSGTATLVCDPEKPRQSARTILNDNGLLTLSGLEEGMCIEWIVTTSGANRTLGITPPAGWQLRWPDNTTPSILSDLDDDQCVRVNMYARGWGAFNALECEVTDFGTVTGVTSEGGGAEDTLEMDDEFNGTPGASTNLRTPDQTPGPDVWENNGFFVIGPTGDYAKAEIEINHGTVYTWSSANHRPKVTMNMPGGAEWASVWFNRQSAGNGWQIRFRLSDGYTQVNKWVSGTPTEIKNTISVIVADTDFTVKPIPNGDSVTFEINGSLVSALSLSETGRQFKSAQDFEIQNGTSGFTKFKRVQNYVP